MADQSGFDEVAGTLVRRLLDRRTAADHWQGHLSSSALSTGTAILALHLAGQGRKHRNVDVHRLVAAGARWLVGHQNGDGGWGDTIRSRSNISTTAIVWGALSMVPAEGGRRPWPSRKPHHGCATSQGTSRRKRFAQRFSVDTARTRRSRYRYSPCSR